MQQNTIFQILFYKNNCGWIIHSCTEDRNFTDNLMLVWYQMQYILLETLMNDAKPLNLKSIYNITKCIKNILIVDYWNYWNVYYLENWKNVSSELTDLEWG